MEADDVPALPPRLLARPSYVLSLLGQTARRDAMDAVAQARPGFRLGHVAALAALEDFGPTSQRALGRRLRQDPSDVVALVDDLEAAKLVRRDPDPDDRRRRRVTITAAGRRALTSLERAIDARQDALLAPLTREERATLHRLAGRLLAAADPRAR